mmetsp:Transcript_58363/g.161405  ORF Transcript_58363/g.161405 Transcript_58363/m.161405 type:complete len:284 (+) Transcript_58363:480-1331(+)
MTWLSGCPCRLTMQKDSCCLSLRSTSRTAKSNSMPGGTTRDGQRCCTPPSRGGGRDASLRRQGSVPARELPAPRDNCRCESCLCDSCRCDSCLCEGGPQLLIDGNGLGSERALCVACCSFLTDGRSRGAACCGPNSGSNLTSNATTMAANAPKPNKGNTKFTGWMYPTWLPACKRPGDHEGNVWFGRRPTCCLHAMKLLSKRCETANAHLVRLPMPSMMPTERTLLLSGWKSCHGQRCESCSAYGPLERLRGVCAPLRLLLVPLPKPADALFTPRASAALCHA